MQGTTHRSHLQHLLLRPFGAANALESIEASNRLDAIYDRLAKVCDGEVIAAGPQRHMYWRYTQWLGSGSRRIIREDPGKEQGESRQSYGSVALELVLSVRQNARKDSERQLH